MIPVVYTTPVDIRLIANILSLDIIKRSTDNELTNDTPCLGPKVGLCGPVILSKKYRNISVHNYINEIEGNVSLHVASSIKQFWIRWSVLMLTIRQYTSRY